MRNQVGPLLPSLKRGTIGTLCFVIVPQLEFKPLQEEANRYATRRLLTMCLRLPCSWFGPNLNYKKGEHRA